MVSVDDHDARPRDQPSVLFAFPRDGLFLETTVLTPYAVGANGRFYAVRQLPRVPAPVTQINLILNWFEALKSRVVTQ